MILTPQQIGMPAQFTEWRDGQGEAIDRITDAFIVNGKRFVVMCAPVGSGKTVTYIAVALAMGWRVLILTSTKGLQDQLERDFGCIGLVDIRGRANYSCNLGASVTCEEGAHMRCPDMGSHRCPYRNQYQLAITAAVVVTNYTYDALIHMYGEGLGEFDLVVMDEAHDAPQEVTSVMGQTFTKRNLEWMLRSDGPEGGEDAPLESWRAWAAMHLGATQRRHELLLEGIRQAVTVERKTAQEARRWGELVKSLRTVAGMVGPWAVEKMKPWDSGEDGAGFRLEPLWARQYAASVLFRDHPRILLCSATVTHKTVSLLGLKPEEFDFQTYPYLFPVRRTPIYYYPVAKIQYDSTEEELALLQQAIDEIMDGRQDRNGIIHAVSYDRAQWLMQHLLFNHVMFTHERNSESTREAVRRFEGLQYTPPAVLVSPSIATGNDFKYRKAEYQIVPKCPFPSIHGSKIMQARCGSKKNGGDPQYRNYLMTQTLAQAFGRIMRAKDDRGETFVLDSNFGWVRTRLRAFFPAWVLRLVQPCRRIPAPPPALAIEMQERANGEFHTA